MTTIRVSQLGAINVLGGVSSGLRLSQLGAIAIANPPVALGLRMSMLGTITVLQNAQVYQVLTNPTKLGCWTPCGVLIWNHNKDGRIP